MHDSINCVISVLLRATPPESGEGIDHNLHISDTNIKPRAEKRSQNDKLLTNYRDTLLRNGLYGI